MINIYDLNVKFKNRNVFSHNYFSFFDTGITWLKGSSGSGKTTLLKVILNKVNYQGKCIIDGINYHSNTMITSKKVFGILSDDYLLINKTIEENLYFYYTDASIEKVTNFLDKYHLKNCFNVKLKNLSRGQVDLVKVLLTILSDADYYLFDEIISSFDRENKILILEDLKKISLSKGIIFSSHNQEIASFSDFIVDLEQENNEEKKLEQYNIYQEKINNTSYTFNSFSLFKAIIFLLISILSLDFIHIDSNEEYLQEDEIAIFNDNNAFLCNKKNIETFFNECPSLIGIRSKEEKNINITYNDYFKLSLMPKNDRQNNLHYINDNNLKNYEIMISDKIYDYLVLQIKNYGFTDFNINNLKIMNYCVKGKFPSNYYEMKLNNFTFYNFSYYYEEYPIILSNKYNVSLSYNKDLEKKAIFLANHLPIKKTMQYIDEKAIYINYDNYDELTKVLALYYKEQENMNQYFYPYNLENDFQLESGSLPLNENDILIPSYFKDSLIEEKLKSTYHITGYYKQFAFIDCLKILTNYKTYFTQHILNNSSLEAEVIFKSNNLLETTNYFKNKGFEVKTLKTIIQSNYQTNEYINTILIASSIIIFFQLLNFVYDEAINKKIIFVSLLKNQSIIEKQKEKRKKLSFDYLFSIFSSYLLSLSIILIYALRFEIINSLIIKLSILVISSIFIITSLIYLIISLIVIRKIKYIYLKN